MEKKLYPDSKVEVSGFEAKHYDTILDIMTFGTYGPFLKRAVDKLIVPEGGKVIDLGAGGGRVSKLIADRVGPDGTVVCVEKGEDMIRVFEQRCKNIPQCRLIKARIDQPLDLTDIEGDFDLAFMSFVLHGLPHDARLRVLENVRKLLKKEGVFAVLDYNQWQKVGLLKKFLFTKIECPYSYDFIRRDWHKIMKEYGFEVAQEDYFFFGAIKLMQFKKTS